MIRKLTINSWISVGILSIFCMGIAGFFLWKFGPAALEALNGYTPALAEKESISGIYFGAGIGLLLVIVELVVIIKELKKSVRKRVKQYLKEHPEVTMEQLDEDFAAAQHIDDNLWIGKRWSFSHCLNCILVENDKIAWVYSEIFESKYSKYYYLCLGLADGRVEKMPISNSLNDISKINDVYLKFPHIVVGNSPEYGYMFKNNRNAFLNLKYHQNSCKSD